MRLTRKENSKKEIVIENEKNKINRDKDKINDKGVYLQKILNKNKDYKTINNKMIIDKNNIKNCDENIQNILSSEEKRQKAFNYIITSKLNREKYKQIKINRINHNSYNSYNYRYNYFPTEQNVLIDSYSINTEMSKDGQNFRDKYKIKDDNKITKIETPTKNKENFDNIKDNIFNNKLTTKHINKNNLPFPKIQKKFFTNNKDIKSFEKSYNFDPSFNNIEESINKKFDKKKNINRRQEFFKKLSLIDNDESKNEIITNNKQSSNKNNLIQSMQSPRASTSKRHYSPFNDILSRSTNNFYINKIPNNENDYSNYLTIKYSNNKNSLERNITDKEELPINKYIKNNYKKKNNSNKSFFISQNSFLKNRSIIYRSKKAVNKTAIQSISLNKKKSIHHKYKKNYIGLNSRILNENENESETLKEIENYNFGIKENEKKEDNMNKIAINNEELKKYLNYFIKDITPININQFVIYSHSNNNYKNDENNENNDFFSINKKCIPLNNSLELKLNQKFSKKQKKIFNNSYINEFNNKLKENFSDFENNNTINKILVKKRPLNENNNPQQNDDNNINYNGFYISRYIKGENILNLPINNDNIYMINQLLKEYGYEINKIKSNKLSSKEKNNQKKKTELTNQKNDSNKKKRYNTNVDMSKLTSNKKENSKIIDSGLNSTRNKITNSNNKNFKNRPTTLKEKKNLNNIYDDNKIPKKIVVKLNENFEELERNYLNKKKEK